MQLEHQPEIVVLQDPEAVAHFVVSEIIKQVKLKANSVLTIPTGKTPERTYELLVEAVQNGEVNFDKVTLRMLDEYACLERKDSRTFQNHLRRKLIDPINFPNDRFQTIDSWPEDDFPEEARRFENLIKRTPSDLTILGIGQNAHIGFNEPPARPTDRTRVVQLSDDTLRANKKDISKHGKRTPEFAITQGIGNILESKRIILMATGKSKADIIRQAVREAVSAHIPASYLRLHPKTIFFLDRAAASQL